MRKRIFLMIAAGDLTAGTQDYIQQFISRDSFKFRNWTVSPEGFYATMESLDEDSEACASSCRSNEMGCGLACVNRHTDNLCFYDIVNSSSNCHWLNLGMKVHKELICGNSMQFVSEKWFEIFWESDDKVMFEIQSFAVFM
jgi:hypothetical protein